MTEEEAPELTDAEQRLIDYYGIYDGLPYIIARRAAAATDRELFAQ